MQFTFSCKSGSRTIVHQFNTDDEIELDAEFDSFVKSCKVSDSSIGGLYDGVEIDPSDVEDESFYTYSEHSDYSLNGQTDVPSQPTYRVDSDYKMNNIYEVKASDLSSTWPFPEGSRP